MAKRVVKILSWNVNGIRSVCKKGFMDWLGSASPDILCVQETKASPEQLDETVINPPGYSSYWSSAEKKGYSGVAVYAKTQPLSVQTGLGIKRFDDEGRVVRLDYPDFVLFNVYFPNGKMSAARLQFKLDFYDAFLDQLEELRKTRKRLVFVGDVNTAHNEIDLARPKENSNVSGFLPVERKWMDKAVSAGYVDTFRHFHPDTVQYTWWDLRTRARARDIGWRLDYVFVTQEMLGSIKTAFVLPDVAGSDHCPVGIELETARL